MTILWITIRASDPIKLGLHVQTSPFMNGLVHIYSQSIENFVQLIYKWTKLIFRLEQIFLLVGFLDIDVVVSFSSSPKGEKPLENDGKSKVPVVLPDMRAEEWRSGTADHWPKLKSSSVPVVKCSLRCCVSEQFLASREKSMSRSPGSAMSILLVNMSRLS